MTRPSRTLTDLDRARARALIARVEAKLPPPEKAPPPYTRVLWRQRRTPNAEPPR